MINVKLLIREEVYRVLSEAKAKNVYPKLSEQEFNNCNFSDFNIQIPKKFFTLLDKFKTKYKELIDRSGEGEFYDPDTNPLYGPPDYQILWLKVNQEEGTLDVQLELLPTGYSKGHIEDLHLPIFKKYDEYQYYLEEYEYTGGTVTPFMLLDQEEYDGEGAFDYLKSWIKGINKTIKFNATYDPADDDIDDDAREAKYNRIFGGD